MIVCSCNVLSDGAVRACLLPGPGCPRTPAQVYACLGCSAKCGRCARTIRAIMHTALGQTTLGDVALGDGAHACTTACVSVCSLVKVQTAEAEIAA